MKEDSHNIKNLNTLVTLKAECRRNENSLYIPGYSKCILKILTTFWVHSKYSGPILVAGPNVFAHAQNFQGAFEVEKISTGIQSVL